VNDFGAADFVGRSRKCASCHGPDGNAINFADLEEPEFLGHVAEILREEVDELVRLGATYLQIDAPQYPLLLDPRWRAWYESRGAHEKTVTMRTEGQGAYTKAQVEREELAGDPRFLGGVQWCVEQRLKIFGVYTATRIDMTWREQAEREGYDADKLFSELVAAARARLDEAGGAGSPGDGETTGDQQAE